MDGTTSLETPAAAAKDAHPAEAARGAEARLITARRRFDEAMHDLRDAIYDDMRTRLAQLDPAARDGFLRRTVKTNSSGWSGGPYTAANVREGITREVYLGQLTAGC